MDLMTFKRDMNLIILRKEKMGTSLKNTYELLSHFLFASQTNRFTMEEGKNWDGHEGVEGRRLNH